MDRYNPFGGIFLSPGLNYSNSLIPLFFSMGMTFLGSECFFFFQVEKIEQEFTDLSGMYIDR